MEKQNEVVANEQEKESALKAVEFDFKVVEGKLVGVLSHEGSDAGVELKVVINTDNLLDKIEKAIPGDWDKAPIAILKATLKNIK